MSTFGEWAGIKPAELINEGKNSDDFRKVSNEIIKYLGNIDTMLKQLIIISGKLGDGTGEKTNFEFDEASKEVVKINDKIGATKKLVDELAGEFGYETRGK